MSLAATLGTVQTGSTILSRNEIFPDALTTYEIFEQFDATWFCREHTDPELASGLWDRSASLVNLEKWLDQQQR